VCVCVCVRGDAFVTITCHIAVANVTPLRSLSVGVGRFSSSVVSPALSSDDRLSALSTADGAQHRISLEVRNTGSRSGVVTVLAMWRPTGGMLSPLRQKLFAFDGVHLEPGANHTLAFTLTSEHLAVADETGQRTVHAGEYEVFFRGVHEGPTKPLRLLVVGPDRQVEV
jgi:hypothetical protein